LGPWFGKNEAIDFAVHERERYEQPQRRVRKGSPGQENGWSNQKITQPDRAGEQPPVAPERFGDRADGYYESRSSILFFFLRWF